MQRAPNRKTIDSFPLVEELILLRKKEDIMNRFIIILMLHCFLLTSVPLFAQAGPIKKNEPLAAEFKPLKSEVFKGKLVASVFARLYREDKGIITLAGDLKKKGFHAQKWVYNFWGIQQAYRIKGKTATFSFYIQDYARPNSNDLAAIGQVRTTAKDRSEIYSFYLQALNGDFDNAIEYCTNEKFEISKAHSWWFYVKSRLPAYPATCEASLVACAAASWAGYLRCVATAWDLPYTKGPVCSGCGCRWWCKWGVGCCDGW